MADPFTIRIFVPDGDPERVRLIDRMNWTGLGLVFRRTDWSEVRKRDEMQRTGIYVLVGYGNENDDLLILYVLLADDTCIKRLTSPVQNADTAKSICHTGRPARGASRAPCTPRARAITRRPHDHPIPRSHPCSLTHCTYGGIPHPPKSTQISNWHLYVRSK